jgi:predicted nucleic acid-binding protein
VGLRSRLDGRLVYFDANIFIYVLEGFPAFQSQLTDIRDGVRAGSFEVVTSELTLCEVLVAPFRKDDASKVAAYVDFLEKSRAVSLLPTTRSIYKRAALIRASVGLKTADAIHVASAMDAGCTAFLTNDRGLRTPQKLERVLFAAPH